LEKFLRLREDRILWPMPQGGPVVALESTVAHGLLPRPLNLQTASGAMESRFAWREANTGTVVSLNGHFLLGSLRNRSAFLPKRKTWPK